LIRSEKIRELAKSGMTTAEIARTLGIRYRFAYGVLRSAGVGAKDSQERSSNATAAKPGLALSRNAWLFAGSDRGAERAAVMYTLIGTAKLNDVDPQAWLADVLARIADTPQNRLTDLLPWNWKAQSARLAA
jgi:hypothetical protein